MSIECGISHPGRKGLPKKEQVATTELDWIDCVAFVIAVLQTSLLP